MLLSYGAGVRAPQLSLVLAAVNLLAVAASPFGAAAAGYLWGAGADVPRSWPPPVVATFGAAAVGFAAAYLLSMAMVALGDGTVELARFAVESLYHLVTVAGLAGVALAALAGAAVAEFRRPAA